MDGWMSVVKGQNCQIGWRLQKGSRNFIRCLFRYITGQLFGIGEQNKMTCEFVLKCL